MKTVSETMNCEEYRQAVAADPSFDGGADHLSGCAQCQLFRDELQALDVNIAKALEVNVPPLNLPELPDIESEDNVVSLSSRRSFTKPAWFALAASVMLAAVLGVRMFAVDVGHLSLADEVLAHLDHEPYALVVSSTPVSTGRLERVVPANIAQLDHSAGLISIPPCVLTKPRKPGYGFFISLRNPIPQHCAS